MRKKIWLMCKSVEVSPPKGVLNLFACIAWKHSDENLSLVLTSGYLLPFPPAKLQEPASVKSWLCLQQENVASKKMALW